MKTLYHWQYETEEAQEVHVLHGYQTEKLLTDNKGTRYGITCCPQAIDMTPQ